MLKGTRPIALKEGGYTEQQYSKILQIEGHRETYGHVVGGIDTDGGHVRSGARSNVWHTMLKHPSTQNQNNENSLVS